MRFKAQLALCLDLIFVFISLLYGLYGIRDGLESLDDFFQLMLPIMSLILLSRIIHMIQFLLKHPNEAAVQKGVQKAIDEGDDPHLPMIYYNMDKIGYRARSNIHIPLIHIPLLLLFTQFFHFSFLVLFMGILAFVSSFVLVRLLKDIPN